MRESENILGVSREHSIASVPLIVVALPRVHVPLPIVVVPVDIHDAASDSRT